VKKEAYTHPNSWEPAMSNRKNNIKVGINEI
jgi:hypothetical protein